MCSVPRALARALIASCSLLLFPIARAEPPRVMLGVSTGVVFQQPVYLRPELLLDAVSPSVRANVGFRFAFTKAWDGMVYGSVGWIATDAADESGVLWFDMAAAARVRPIGTAWWVQFGALTGFQAPRDGGARGISDYLGVTLGTGLSLDADNVWDLGLVTACRFDTEVGELVRMASPSIELRLGTSL